MNPFLPLILLRELLVYTREGMWYGHGFTELAIDTIDHLTRGR